MKSFAEKIGILVDSGYREDAARAKIAHDAILMAMKKAKLAACSTVKGGVVMSHITADARRTTMDMDVAFVNRSISELSVRQFVKRLNCVQGVRVSIFGTITDLMHDDYRGKRVYLDITDGSVTEPVRIKLDVGVHAHKEIEQLEYAFHLTEEKHPAVLQINSKEQIFCEKLQSLLRHRFLSRRPKDVYDMYYLTDKVSREIVVRYIDILIFADKKCKVKSYSDIVGSLQGTFASRTFVRKLLSSQANWLQVKPEEAMSGIVAFVSSLSE